MKSGFDADGVFTVLSKKGSLKLEGIYPELYCTNDHVYYCNDRLHWRNEIYPSGYTDNDLVVDKPNNLYVGNGHIVLIYSDHVMVVNQDCCTTERYNIANAEYVPSRYGIHLFNGELHNIYRGKIETKQVCADYCLTQEIWFKDGVSNELMIHMWGNFFLFDETVVAYYSNGRNYYCYPRNILLPLSDYIERLKSTKSVYVIDGKVLINNQLDMEELYPTPPVTIKSARKC